MGSDIGFEHSGEILRRANAGDARALAALVERWSPTIEALVRRRAPREALARESASDLAQSVCREALERVDRGAVEYRGEEAFRAWIVGAVDLKLGERWRRAHALRREGDARAGHSQVGEAPGSGPTPSVVASGRESKERLARLLERLDERSRRIVSGVHLEGRSHTELAREFGVTEGHSRTLLARALARLATLAGE